MNGWQLLAEAIRIKDPQGHRSKAAELTEVKEVLLRCHFAHSIGNGGACGQSLVDIANFFVTSDEYIARYGRQNSEDYVRQVYVNVLGRQPDSPGLRWWTYMITNDLMTRGRMMVGFSESAEFQAKYPR